MTATPIAPSPLQQLRQPAGTSRRRGQRSRPRLSVVDLFSGAGGISEGFRQAGYHILAGADSDPDAVATYAANFPGARAITGDVRDPAVMEQILAIARHADVIAGGPPCQAFSQVRNHTRMIDDPRNALYREFVRVVRASLPLAFVMENVTGIDQMGARQQIAFDLAMDGEYIITPQVLDAADFGVPQTRKRLLFIGIRKSAGIVPPVLSGTGATESISLIRYSVPRPVRYQVKIQERLGSHDIGHALTDPENTSIVTASCAISDLEELETGNRSDEIPYERLPPARSAYQRMMREQAGEALTNVQVPRINTDTELRLASVPAGGNYRDLPEEMMERYITGQRWGQANGTGKLSRQHFYAYRRLHPDIWAWTLNTKGDSVYHYKYPRSLSVREFARLQSFPDRFVFTTDPRKGMLPGRHDGGAAHSRYRQAGNAVPPLLACAVATALALAISATVEPVNAFSKTA